MINICKTEEKKIKTKNKNKRTNKNENEKTRKREIIQKKLDWKDSINVAKSGVWSLSSDL